MATWCGGGDWSYQELRCLSTLVHQLCLDKVWTQYLVVLGSIMHTPQYLAQNVNSKYWNGIYERLGMIFSSVACFKLNLAKHSPEFEPFVPTFPPNM